MMGIVRSFVCGKESHLQVTWSMIKVNKHLYIFLQLSNTTNDDYIKRFDSYDKVVEHYVGRTPIHPGLVKYNIIEM